MVRSEELMDFYEKYFSEKGAEWLDWYQSLCINLFYTKERSVIISLPAVPCHTKGNAYQNALAAAALSRETEDRIILMEPKRRMGFAADLGISVFDAADINDASGNNLFSMYTLPVNGKAVPEGSDSMPVAEWIGRFLSKEKYIQIFDSYLLTKSGIGYLKKYILKYIQEGADIQIYSLEHSEEYTSQQILEEFNKDFYTKWKFSVYLIDNKKFLHARSIQGSKYIIQIDRGLSVFGRSGKTYQSFISIFENNGIPRIVLKETQIRQIISQ